MAFSKPPTLLVILLYSSVNSAAEYFINYIFPIKLDVMNRPQHIPGPNFIIYSSLLLKVIRRGSKVKAVPYSNYLFSLVLKL